MSARKVPAAMFRFSFLIPTRARTDRLARLFQSVLDTTARPHELEIVLGVDEDDLESQQVTHPSLHIRKTILREGLTMGQMNTACFEASSGRFLMLMNDDVILRTRDWDLIVGGVFAQFEDDIALVHVNDLLFKERLCTFPMLSRRACLAIGVCPPAYKRYRIDDHIYDTYNLLAFLGHRRLTYLEDVIFEHENFEKEEGQTADQLFRSADHKVYVPDPAIIEVDARLFDESFDQRKRDAVTLAGLIERHREASRDADHAAALVAVTDSYSYRQPEFVLRRSGPRDRGSETVAVAIVTADSTAPHAAECIARVKAHTRDFDLTVLDNNRSPRFNHPREMNRALRAATSDFLVLMDDDVHVDAGWLDALIGSMDDRTGMVAPMHRDRNGRLSFSGVYLMGDRLGTHAHHLDVPDAPRRCQALCSALMLIDLRKVRPVLLSERYDKYFLDLDYSFRIWEAGYHVVCTPATTVTHLAGATMPHGSVASHVLWNKDLVVFTRDWVDSGRLDAIATGIWQQDPFTALLAGLPRRIEALCRDSGHAAPAGFSAELRQVEAATREFPLFRSFLVTNLRACAEACRHHGHWTIAGLCDEALLELQDVAVVHAGPMAILHDTQAGYNIVEYGGEFFGVPQAIGPCDVTQAAHRSRPELLTGATIEAVRAMIVRHPIALETFEGFEVVHYATRYFAIPCGEGPFTLAAVQRAGYSTLLVADTVDDARSKVRQARAAAAAVAEPAHAVLVDAHQGYNLVRWDDWWYGLPQSLGPVDLADPAQRDRPEIVDAPTADSLRRGIEAHRHASRRHLAPGHGTGAEPLLIESRGVFNIVLYASKYFAIPQNDGAFDMGRIRAHGYSAQFVGSTLDEVRRELEAAGGDRAAAPGGRPAAARTHVLVLGQRPARDIAPLLDGLAGQQITVLAPAGEAASWNGYEVLPFRNGADAPADHLDPDVSPRLLEELTTRRIDAVAIAYGADWNWGDSRLERLAPKIAPRLIALFDGGRQHVFKGEDIHRIVYNKSYLASVFSVVPSLGGQRVLDVGCSDGLVCHMLLTEAPASVTGIDVLETVGCNYPDPAITYHNMDAGAMRFPDHSFDVAISIATLEHVPEPIQVIREMTRVTRPGGSCYVQAGPLYFSPFGHHMFGYFDEVPWIHLRRTPAEIVRYAKLHGAEEALRRNLGRDAQHYVEGMLTRDHINGKTLREYQLDDFMRRPDIEVLKFTPSYEGESLLTPEILREILPEHPGLTREDLIGHGFELAFRVR
jgi:SAM-dependent methyltransferase